MSREITPAKDLAYLGVPWEESFGYAQAVRIGDTIHVSGQMSHDGQGQLVAPARLGVDGVPSDSSQMEAQIRAIYGNAAKVLASLGATLDDVVQETLFVLDVPAAFAAASRVRKEVYGTDRPPVASNLIGVTRLAFAEQLAEIAFVAVMRGKAFAPTRL